MSWLNCFPPSQAVSTRQKEDTKYRITAKLQERFVCHRNRSSKKRRTEKQLTFNDNIGITSCNASKIQMSALILRNIHCRSLIALLHQSEQHNQSKQHRDLHFGVANLNSANVKG